jgi:hypothetical protein
VWNFGLLGTVRSRGVEEAGFTVRPPATPNPTGRALNCVRRGGSALAERERTRVLDHFGSCGMVMLGLKARALSAPSSLRNELVKRAVLRKEELPSSVHVLASDMDCTDRFAARSWRLSDRERVRNLGECGWVSGAEDRC